MSQIWNKRNINSFTIVNEALSKLQGVIVGFNTNIDAIVKPKSSTINQLFQRFQLNYSMIISADLPEKIANINDFLIGFFQSFRNGSAKEYQIESQKLQKEILKLLPKAKNLRMGGQAGIISNLLADLGIPLVITHTAELTPTIQDCYTDSSNLYLPHLTDDGNFELKQPKELVPTSNEDYHHTIIEFKKSEILSTSNNHNISCPRNNRLIISYDPPNSILKISSAFEKGITKIANKANLFIHSGYHLLTPSQIGKEKTIERINTVLGLLHKAKESNPYLIVHFEMCSMEDSLLKLILQEYKNKNLGLWESLGVNEQELMALLRALDNTTLAQRIANNYQHEDIIRGCQFVQEALKIKRMHLHEYGCYHVLTTKDWLSEPVEIRMGLSYASLIAAFRAKTGEIPTEEKQVKKLFAKENCFNSLSDAFIQTAKNLSKFSKITEYEFQRRGIAKLSKGKNYIAIPTILISKPSLTVGLGDTISSTSLVGELASRESLSNKKKGLT
jgi:ADP-dependent phosphofructokinase/glucokinase